MTLSAPFDNSYAALPDGFFTRTTPTPVADPKLLAFNAPLAKTLGITHGSTEDLAFIFSGNELPAGADPLAQLYAGISSAITTRSLAMVARSSWAKCWMQRASAAISS